MQTTVLKELLTLHPLSAWHEELGPVLWWFLDSDGNPTEPPYVGSPNDCGHTVECAMQHYVGGSGELKETRSRTDVGGWPGYHQYWSPIPMVGRPDSHGQDAPTEAAPREPGSTAP